MVLEIQAKYQLQQTQGVFTAATLQVWAETMAQQSKRIIFFLLRRGTSISLVAINPSNKKNRWYCLEKFSELHYGIG
jgi:hypothetical protein